MTDDFTTAQPSRTSLILDRRGLTCTAATRDSYPLRAVCASCGEPIRCADGTADWGHTATGQGRCAQ